MNQPNRKIPRRLSHRWALACLLCWMLPGHMLFAQAESEVAAESLRRARLAEQRRIEVIATACQATISVFAATGGGGGSGVVISPDGYALTNYHVVKPCGDYMHCSMPDGKLYDAVLVGLDPTGDVALIKLLGRDDFPVASMGDSDQVRVGDYCFAVGNPFLLATDFQPTVTWGIVSGVHRYQYPSGTLLEYADCIQTDAAINPGNSGGALFNARSELIGINGRGSFEKRGRVNVGVGYAISINQIKYFLDQLAAGRIVDHATLGATVSSDSQGRVVVDNILKSSDAYRRGLRYDDEIVAFGGRTIQTVNEFKNVLGIYPKGWRVPLTYQREGQTIEITVRLAALHDAEQLIEMIQGKSNTQRRIPHQPETPDPETPDPEAAPVQTPRQAIPDEAKKLIETKHGFANFYFNRLRQQDIWSRFQAAGDTSSVDKKWQLQGVVNDEIPIRIVLDQSGSGIQWGSQASVLNLDEDFSRQLVPSGSGGLVPALHLWHRLLTIGPDAYGATYYLGSLPTSSGLLSNILVGTFDITETRFQFDRETAQLIGLEMWSDSGQDPCEIEFSNFRDHQGIQLPRTMTVTHGDNFRWVIVIEDVEFVKSQHP